MSETHKKENTVLPSVDISLGTVAGTIDVGDQFNFTTTTAGNPISVTVPAGPTNAWFSPSPAIFSGPGSVTVTALLPSTGQGWGFGVAGINRQNNNPRIPVGGGVPQAKAS